MNKLSWVAIACGMSFWARAAGAETDDQAKSAGIELGFRLGYAIPLGKLAALASQNPSDLAAIDR